MPSAPRHSRERRVTPRAGPRPRVDGFASHLRPRSALPGEGLGQSRPRHTSASPGLDVVGAC